jgi:hypothetical protein
VKSSPPVTTTASASAIGVLMVTGVTISKTAIAVSSPALTAKTRQKRGKRVRGIVRR